MTNLFSLPIWTVNLAFSEEISLVSPLLIPETLSVNESAKNLANALIKRLEEGNIKQGDYLEMLRQAPSLSLLNSQLFVSLKAPRKQPLYPDLALKFDYFYTVFPNQHCLGFIPVLGIEGYAKTAEELVTVLQRAIELEFSRKKRYSSVQRLITTQWYQKIEFKQHVIETRFHSLSELANLHKGRKQQWLPKIAQALPQQAKYCFGREKELEQMLRALTGKYSRSVLLVGRAGVGKTALVKEVYRVGITQGLGSIKFWETTAARMLQKLTVESGWEESFGQLLEELNQRGDILYVRNLAQLFEVGAYVGNPISMAEFMRDYLALGSVRMITECTDEEFASIETRAPGYTNLFQVLRIEPPPVAQQADIVRNRLSVSHPQQNVTEEAIDEILRLQHRYALYSGFPGKTVHFLEALLNQEKLSESLLDREAVVTRFCDESGMPRFLVDSRTALQLEETRQFFHSRLFGQNSAIDIVIDLLASVKTRLTRPGKPIASLLFVGPTGVGKTELAKALAEFMFGDSERLIRFDMSEFSDEIAVLRLTGDVSGGQGLLTDKIRQQPFSVVLFDELEKAHFAFYDLLLQVMGEGRLTDARGQVADFCSSVIIMTSNIGAGVSRQRSPGFFEKDHSPQALTKHYLHAVQHFFRPELFNRLDQVIPFNALDLSVLRPIVRRELDKILARDGLRTRDVTIQVEDPVIDYLAETSSNSHYGARQLQRCLHEQVVIPLTATLNHYSFSTSMKVTLVQGKNGLEFKTMIYTQKARADQTLTDSKWTLRKLTTAANTARRLAQQIDDGPPMNQLWSKWDILERRRRQMGEKFWQYPLMTHEYGILHNLIDKAKVLLQQIETIEIDCSLAFIGLDVPITELPSTLLDWQNAYQAWQLQLLNIAQPEMGLCLMGIYGSPDYLSNIMNVFNHLIENHAWEIIGRTVWFRDKEKRYLYTNHSVPSNQLGGELAKLDSQIAKQDLMLYFIKKEEEKEEDTEEDTEENRENGVQEWVKHQTEDRLVGYEAQIAGAGATLYFAKEGGVHTWMARGQERHPFAVIIVQCAMNKFQTPQGVYRKKFLENLDKQREYWKDGFSDSRKPTSYTGSNWLSVLKNLLDEDFKEQLRKILCGEVIEIEVPTEDTYSPLEYEVPF